MPTITITGTGSSTACFVEINGSKYYQSTTLEVNRGVELNFTATSTRANSQILINGIEVANSTKATYTLTVVGDTSIDLTRVSSVVPYYIITVIYTPYTPLDIYIGVPRYEYGTIQMTEDNVNDFFEVTTTTDTTGWTSSFDNALKLVPNNIGVNSKTASIELTTKTDIKNVDIGAQYYTESSYDKVTLKVGSTTVLSAVSGSSAYKSRWTGSIPAGTVITISYSKDSSNHASKEADTYVDIAAVKEDRDNVIITEVARKVVSQYIGVNGIARKITKVYVGDENGKARLV